MRNRLTDVQIAIQVVPTMVRWPDGKTVAWDRLRDCVEALRDLVRTLDDSCLRTEQDRNMSRDSIARQRAELGNQALAELAGFRPFQIAEKAVSENIDLLEKDRALNPKHAQMQQRLAKALNELREGVAATKRMVLERCPSSRGTFAPSAATSWA